MSRQYLYSGRDLFAVIEQREDGWHPIMQRDRQDLGAFPTRSMAVSMVNARRANVAAAPLTGERQADVKQIQNIRQHQRIERDRRARRAVGSKR